jgi:Protein of unknown function (DUF2804)
MSAGLPYRGAYGAPRPRALDALELPPGRMRAWNGLRPLKRWRYVGVYGARFMVCIGDAHVGPGRQAFWAVWDREAQQLHERTRLGTGGVELGKPGRAVIRDGGVRIELVLEEDAGVETVCPNGGAYAWTRKQGGIRAHGELELDGVVQVLDARAIVDDSAGYHARRTAWQWCAGVGTARDGRALAWNLVAGINDPPHESERTLWVDGAPVETAPATFAADLSRVQLGEGAGERGGALAFSAEAVRERRENLLIVRSAYRQPFGTFAGALPGGIELAEGYGVMEEHTARW